MALHLTPSRLHSLLTLYQAEPEGLAVDLAEDDRALWRHIVLFEEHHLVKRVHDDSRILRERYRLSWEGRRYAEFFTKEAK